VVIRRGDIVLADLDPTVGNEANKRRPVIVVSNNGANRAASETGVGVVIVVPLTSNVRTVHLFQVFIPATDSELRADSKAQVEQLRAISVARISERLGRIPDDLMIDIDRAIRRQLDV
jgi:mRNA interferase MazF